MKGNQTVFEAMIEQMENGELYGIRLTTAFKNSHYAMKVVAGEVATKEEFEQDLRSLSRLSKEKISEDLIVGNVKIFKVEDIMP